MGPKLPAPGYGDPEKTNPAALRLWQINQIHYEHPYRLRQSATWRYADLMDQDVQWLCRSYNVDTTATQHWTRILFRPGDPEAIPTPVLNEFSEPIENEAARLGKPEYKPYARVDESADLKKRTGAKLAEQVIKYCLSEMAWAEQEDLGLLHMPLYGQWHVMSYWDQDLTKTTRLPQMDAMRCPDQSCDFRTAKPTIDANDAFNIDPSLAPERGPQNPSLVPEQGLGYGETGQDAGYGSNNYGVQSETEPPPSPINVTQEPTKDGKSLKSIYNLTNCPQCKTHVESQDQTVPHPETGEPITTSMPVTMPGGPALEPYTPVDAELYQQDAFGRDLGQDVALGEWKMKTIFPDQLFVENLGIDVENGHVRMFTYIHPEPLDSIRSHWANGYLVKPESPEEIMRYHPITGERAIFFGNYVASGVGIFRNYCRVRETYIQPYIETVKDENGELVMGEDGRPQQKRNRGRKLVMAGNTVLFDGDLEIQSQNDPGVWIPCVHLENIVWKPRSGGREFHGVSLSEHLFDMQENVNEIASMTQDARTRMGFPSWSAPRGMNLRFNRGDKAGGVWQYDYDPSYGNVRPEVIGNELLNSEVYQEVQWMLDYKMRSGGMSPVDTGNVPPGVAAALAIQMLAEQSGEKRRSRIRRIREAYERLYSHGLMLMHELVREPRELWEETEDSSQTEKSWVGLDLQGVTTVKIKAEPDHDSEVQVQQATRDALEAGLFDLTDARTRRVVGKQLGVKNDIFEQQDLQENAAETEFINFRDEDDPPVRNEDTDDDMDHYERHVIDILHDEQWKDIEKQAGWKTAWTMLSGWNSNAGMQPRPVTLATGQVVMAPAQSPFEQFMAGPGMMLRTRLPELQILACWRGMLIGQQYQPGPDEQGPLDKCLRWYAHVAGHRMGMEQERAAAAQGAQIAVAPGGAATQAGTVPAGGGAPSGAPPGQPLMPQPTMEVPGSRMGA